MQIIVLTILAIIVLITLAVAYRSQIGSLLASFTDLIGGATESADSVDLSGLVE